MFRIPRDISDTLRAAPYVGGFVVSLLEALLTSSRRQVGEWSITSVDAVVQGHGRIVDGDAPAAQFIMNDNNLGLVFRVTVEAVDSF